MQAVRATPLTVPQSVWLSAAVGVAAGGALYFIAFFSTAMLLVVLRFGPRTPNQDDDDTLPLYDGGGSSGQPSPARSSPDSRGYPNERTPLASAKKKKPLRAYSSQHISSLNP